MMLVESKTVFEEGWLTAFMCIPLDPLPPTIKTPQSRQDFFNGHLACLTLPPEMRYRVFLEKVMQAKYRVFAAPFVLTHDAQLMRSPS